MQSAVGNAVVQASKPETRAVDQRRFPPKGPTEELQESGQLSREFVLEFTKRCAETLLSEESINMLEACSSLQEIGQLSVSWQREMLEHLGVQMDFGCKRLGEVPQRFDADTEVMEAFKAFQIACQQSAQAAQRQWQIKHGGTGSENGAPSQQQQTMQALPPEKRRFPPKPAKQLQTGGKLSRKFILEFTKKCAEMLLSKESIGMLSMCNDMNEVGLLSVRWQRELLEHLGVEMEYGCQALGQTPNRFGNDPEVMLYFKQFQMACAQSAQAASEKVTTRSKTQAAYGNGQVIEVG